MGKSNTIMHKSGYINIIGNPNVGKSSLMNALVGEKLSVITSKVQTTRHRILGIVNDENYQAIFSDTPGIIEEPHYLMQERMMKFIETALLDADVFVYVTEPKEKPLINKALKRIKESGIPLVIIINKIDLGEQKQIQILIDRWKELLAPSMIIPASVMNNFNVDAIFHSILELLPESPPYYPKDELTDKPERFFVTEIIREKILDNYKKEVPYSVEVAVDSFKEKEEIVNIRAYIYVSRDSQKGIIIGKKGAALKKTGSEARIDIEKFLGKKVYLELFVKVNKNWRDKENQLKRFGYYDV
jgi:GTP-binding protein Era